jgi:hypothetical protein
LSCSQSLPCGAARQRHLCRAQQVARTAKTNCTANSESSARQRIPARQSQQWRTISSMRTAKSNQSARQRNYDGKDPTRRTTKKCCTANGLDVAVTLPLPCGQTSFTTKAPLPCDSLFAVCHNTFYLFFFLFYFI